MNKNQIRAIIEINNTLANWDPIGSASVDTRWPYSEYIGYVEEVITAYRNNISMEEFVSKLYFKLTSQQPSDEILMNEIKNIANKLEILVRVYQ